jgi:hypothetical protein
MSKRKTVDIQLVDYGLPAQKKNDRRSIYFFCQLLKTWHKPNITVECMRFGRFTVDSTEGAIASTVEITSSTQGTAGAPTVDFFDGR